MAKNPCSIGREDFSKELRNAVFILLHDNTEEEPYSALVSTIIAVAIAISFIALSVLPFGAEREREREREREEGKENKRSAFLSSMVSQKKQFSSPINLSTNSPRYRSEKLEWIRSDKL